MAMIDEITDKDAIIDEIGMSKSCSISSIVKNTHLDQHEVEIYIEKMKKEKLLRNVGGVNHVRLTKDGELAYKGSYQTWKKINYSPMEELVLQVKKIVTSQSKWNWALAIATIVLAGVAVITLVRLFLLGE